MNNRQIIQEKQGLQNDFLISVGQSNKKVMGWLQPLKQDSSNNNKNRSEESAFSDFFKLPIISSGSGLNLEDSKEMNINTIDDHIKNRKTLKVRSDTGKYDAIRATEKKLQAVAGDSKSMQSLKNKLRKDNVRKVRENINNNNPLQKADRSGARSKKVMNHNDGDDESDSDHDRDLRDQRSTKKKTANVMFGKVKKNRK
ncbi:hypothetical protein DASC09_005400 [Saccharomycopsis crataegensis]|uniref:Nucleolar protein 19 n=1 Tax=Saccharomycopsis crataegensis TaxID=43959 RepID=A0AAV5QFN2_9ASCO|nr:hypothetical protein DASC09_005400 [Saccharomycopsis crataegensis]